MFLLSCVCCVFVTTGKIYMCAWVVMPSKFFTSNENSFYSLYLCGFADGMFPWPAAFFAVFNRRFCFFIGGRPASDLADFG